MGGHKIKWPFVCCNVEIPEQRVLVFLTGLDVVTKLSLVLLSSVREILSVLETSVYEMVEKLVVVSSVGAGRVSASVLEVSASTRVSASVLEVS